MSAGAYVMLKFSSREQLLPAVEKITQSDHVAKWDAVDGHYNIVVKLKENDNATIDMLKSLDGVVSFSSCDLCADNDKLNGYDEELSYSFLLIETGKDNVETAYNDLIKNEQINFCSPTTGTYDLVCLASGETFDKIDRLVTDKIKPHDAVLRMKQERIIMLDHV